MRKFFTLFLALAASVGTLFAESGELYFNGVYYALDLTFQTATVVKPTSGVYSGEIVIPKSVKNTSNSIYYPVRHIAESAFANSTVTKVYLPEGLVTIGESAFANSTVTKVFLSEGLVTIGAKAFYNCDKLTSLSIPSTVTEVASNAFDGSKLLTEFIFYPVTPPTITGTYTAPQLQKKAEIYIPDDAYDANSYSSAWGGGNFTFEPLAKNKVLVGDLYYHFNLCSRQAEVRSGEYTFTSLTIPSIAYYEDHAYSVTSIGKSAFRNVTNLKTVTLPEGMKVIGDGAFMQTSVTTLSLPSTLTTIGGYAFAYLVDGKINITCNAVEPPVCGEQCFYLLNTANSKLTVPVAGYDAYKNTEPWSAFGKIEYNDEFTQGDFTFKLNGDAHTASLIAYNKSSAQTAVTIPNEISVGKTTYAVTSIAEQVFANCTSITSVVIPDNVTAVGYKAFAGCTALSNVILPATIPTISAACFDNCTSLPVINGIRYADYMLIAPLDKTKTTYTINAATRLIADYAFYGCDNMTLIVLPDNVEKIGYGAFYKCAALASVIWNNKLVTIGNSAFYECASLSSVSLPQTLKNIDQQAFAGCTSLQQVELREGLEEIGWRAFAKCSALQQIDLPEGLEKIGGEAFHRCASLKQCTIPASVKEMQIGEYVELPGDEDDNTFVSNFSKCDALETVVILSKTIGELDQMSQYFGWWIPRYELGDGIEKLGYRAFYGASGLQSVQLPSTLKTIGKSAFKEQVTLKEIDLPNSVTMIEDSAFCSVYKLQHIDLKNVQSIGAKAFYYAPLQELNLPASVTTIGEKAFEYCTDLKSITSEAVNPPALGDQCFSYDKVRDIPVTVPGTSLEAYQKAKGWKEFTNYKKLQMGLRYEFRDNLTATVIQYEEGSPYRDDIVIPATVENEGKTYTVTTIGYNAFSGCTDLTSVTIPPTVQAIYTDAFWNCNNLQAVNISDIGAWCALYLSASGYIVPNSQPLAYSKRLLLNDVEITDLVIPENTTLVNSFVFAKDLALTSVTFPASVTAIQIGAFSGCENIKTITCYASEVPFTNLYCFEDIDKSIPVYVPAESVEAYKTTGEWSEFTNILPLPQGYELVDLSTETLTAGQYLIVFDDNKAHAAVSGKDLIASSDELTIENDIAYVPEETVCAVTIAPFGTDSFSILLADGKTYMDLQAKNSVTTSEAASGFAITDGGDKQVQIAKFLPSENKTFVLQHNNTNSGYFRMYSSTNYILPKLYRKVAPVTYHIRFLNDDGTVLQESDIESGATPVYEGATPVKDATAQYTYTFTGWDKPIVAASEDIDYTAVFESTLRSYTVTWVNGDGTTLVEESYKYGATPIYKGSEPTRPATAQYEYTFKGWTPEVVAVSKDAAYTAVFEQTLRSYTVTWVNWDGTELDKETYNYGTTPIYKGSEPTRPATAENTFTFSGWSPAIAAVTGDITYKAQFNSTGQTYTVTWKMDDGSVLATETYAYGDLPNYTDPVKPATAQYEYTFKGWTPEVAAVSGDATYTAVFEETLRSYTVTWVNWDGTELDKETYNYGTTPIYKGSEPTRPATAQYEYTFKGWTPEVVAVSKDATYTAVFEQTLRSYTITFVVGPVNYPVTVEYGTPMNALMAGLWAEAQAEYGFTQDIEGNYQYSDGINIYTFTGWDKEIPETVTGEAEYTATYTTTPVTPTDIDQMSTVNSQLSTKILRNGQLYILRDGILYNAQGARVE